MINSKLIDIKYYSHTSFGPRDVKQAGLARPAKDLSWYGIGRHGPCLEWAGAMPGVPL